MTTGIDDHTLLLLLNQRQEQMQARLEQALLQLERGNKRFELIDRQAQQHDQRIADVAQSSQRALGEVYAVRADIRELHKRLLVVEEWQTDAKVVFDGDPSEGRPGLRKTVRDQAAILDTWRVYARIGLLVFGVVNTVVIALLIEALRRTVFGP